MKKTILLFVLLLTFTGFSQTLESLKIETKKMYEASYNMAFQDVLNYTHPKVFESVSREQMEDILNKSFENEMFRIRLVYPNPPFTYSEIKKVEGKTLCIVTYTNAMRMTFEEPLTPEKVETMTNAFKESQEYKTINFEKDRNSLFIEGKATMIAVAEEATKNEWKFVNYSLAQAEMAKLILGETVLKALGF